MSNIHRLQESDRVFFVNVNLSTKASCFTTPELSSLVEVIHKTRLRLGFLFCGYVLMPDHWHALIWPRYPLTISRVLQDIKSVSARRLNPGRRRRGPLWQHQFWDRFVRNAEEFSHRLDYMHYNPVKRGLVNRPEDWRWSSFNNFSLEPSIVSNCPIQIDLVQLPDSYRG
jgi:putative transposase